VEPRAADADDAMRFLRELRQLRNEAGLETAELAARAHYPRDVIVAAEAGPSIPGLPVLSAYVRGCGAGLAEWEERWRSLTGSPVAVPCLPARPAGCSSLADAGARLGAVVSSSAEVLIPAQVMRRLSAPAGTVSAEAASIEAASAEAACAKTVPVAAVSAGTTPAATALAEAALAVAAAGGVSHVGPLPAVGPATLPATRQAGFPRAALAAATAAVMVVLGTILMLLRRRG
jgi:DNA-binding XRE family transcriptional regulator